MKKVLLAILSGILCSAVVLTALYFDLIKVFVQDTLRGEIVLQNEEDLYYYNRLDSREQKAYKKIVDKIEEYPESIAIPYLEKEQLLDVFEAISYDRPDIFCMGTTCRQVKKRNCYYFEVDYAYEQAEYIERKSKLNETIEKIISQIDESFSDYEKELFVHDYIATHCTYTKDSGADTYKAYGALVNGKATCEGYARAMKMILNRIGIKNSLIVGTATDANGTLQGHMWNAVEIGGKYYYLDVTWDDPTGQDSYEPSHIYFNLTSDDIKLNHYGLEDYDFVCDSNDQNYFVKSGTYFENYDSKTLKIIESEIKKAIENGENRVEFRFSDNKLLKETEDALFNKGDVYDVIKNATKDFTNIKIASSLIKIVNERYNVLMIILSYER